MLKIRRKKERTKKTQETGSSATTISIVPCTTEAMKQHISTPHPVDDLKYAPVTVWPS